MVRRLADRGILKIKRAFTERLDTFKKKKSFAGSQRSL